MTIQRNDNNNIGNALSDYAYGDSLEDRKLKAFVNDGVPEGVNLSRIEQLTFRKIHQRKSRRRVVLSLAASLAVVLVMSFSFFAYRSSMGVDEGTLISQAALEYVSIKVPVGEKMTIMLSDGTKIIANSRSEVRYPKVFNGERREVYACGEVYFDVAHDKNHPFIVNTDGVSVKVLGTKFCVNHYSNNQTEVVLIEGCVSATTSNNDAVTMRPNQLLQLENGTFKSLREVDAQEYAGWLNGVLSLHGEDLGMVMTRINDYYGTNYTVDEMHSDIQLYGKLLYQKDVRDVIKSVNALAGTDFH